ncbi:MAG: winged helix-turn-helix domain-containing protein [Prevotella sp.]|nr:winged helix-turn-helix domain-containing protein [Prevotella sp.]
MTVQERVCIYLQDLRLEQHSNTITLPMSRQALANYLGMQKYSLQRCFGELQERGVIQVDNRHILISKPNELSFL